MKGPSSLFRFGAGTARFLRAARFRFTTGARAATTRFSFSTRFGFTRFGFTRATTIARLISCLGFVVGLAAVVRLIEARAFEDDGGTGANQPPQLEFATFGALSLLLVIDSLIQLKFMIARIALIIVSWH